jgi:hypothetical protein
MVRGLCNIVSPSLLEPVLIVVLFAVVKTRCVFTTGAYGAFADAHIIRRVQLQTGKGTGAQAYNGMLDTFQKIIRNEG